MKITNTSTSSSPPCVYCGFGPHLGMCPRIEAIEYRKDRSIKRVQLRDPADDLAKRLGAINRPVTSTGTWSTCGQCGGTYLLGQSHLCVTHNCPHGPSTTPT